MVENKEQIVVGRRSAGYALSMFRANIKENELIYGYLQNTKKDIDDQIVFYLWKWLNKIYPELPQRTKDAWGGQGSARKPFFNWLYKLPNMTAFREFAFNAMKEDEKQAEEAMSQRYGDGVDFGGFSDLAEYNTSDIVNDYENWVLAGGCIPAGDETRGAGLASDAPVPGCYDMDET